MKKTLNVAASTLLKLVAIALLCLPILFIFLLLLMTIDLKVFIALLFLIPALAVAAVAWLIPPRHKKGRKYTLICAAAIATASVIAACSTLGYNVYLNSIRITDNSNINTEEYLPFDENSKIARLDGDASLSFSITDDLPVVDGAAALFPVYSAFVNAVYPKNIPPLNRADSPFKFNNTTLGYIDLIDGKTDIMFGVAPDQSVVDLAEEMGVSLEIVPIGREAFVFFTNARNNIDNLTQQQIKDIYSGKTRNWSEVGGDNLEIQVFLRNGSSGSAAALYRFMGDTPITDVQSEYVFNLMSGIVEAASDYENHRGAIGFSYRYYVSGIMEEKGIRFIPVDGIAPETDTITDGSYPLIENLCLVYREGAVTDEMRALIEWILSPEGQTLVKLSGYAPIGDTL